MVCSLGRMEVRGDYVCARFVQLWILPQEDGVQLVYRDAVV